MITLRKNDPSPSVTIETGLALTVKAPPGSSAYVSDLIDFSPSGSVDGTTTVFGPYETPQTVTIVCTNGAVFWEIGKPVVNYVTVETNPVTGGRIFSEAGQSALSANGLGGFDLAARFKKVTSGTTWLWKHSAATNSLAGSWWAYVPIDTAGHYASFAVGAFGVAGCTPHLGRMAIGLIGSCRHHAAGSGVIKTGTWTTSALDYVSGGSACYSLTAGDQISFSTAGHTLVLRTAAITNGGYGVVSIDGDFSAANRLPAFTQADFDAGLCRLADIGRRYIQTGTNGLVWSDFHVPLAEGLADTAHTVVIEATGTKPSYSSASRCYVAEMVGCSATDIGQSLVVGTRTIAMIETVSDYRGNGASAYVYTPEVEKATPGTFEFLGEVHAAATQVGTTIVDVDGVDRSGAAAGAYYSGNVVQIRVVSTVASTDATGTPVMRKSSTHTFSAAGACPLVTAEKIDWLADRRVKAGYSLMLPVGVSRFAAGVPALENSRWDIAGFGTYQSVATDFTGNANAQRGNVRASMAVVSSTKHSRSAYCALLDGGDGVNKFAQGGPDYVFLIDRADGLDKIYFSRSTASNIERFLSGDSFRSVVGFGVSV